MLALLAAAVAPSIGAWAGFHAAPGVLGNAIYFAGKVVLYGTPLVWLAFVARRRFSLSPLRNGGLGFGALSGLAVGALIWTVYALLPAGAIDPVALVAAAENGGFATLPRFLSMVAGICCINALLEEYAFRWFIYGRVRALVSNRRAAALVAAAVFTVHHVILLRTFLEWPLALLASAGVFAGGLIWTWCYERYGSIWPGYVSHALIDAAILAVVGTVLF